MLEDVDEDEAEEDEGFGEDERHDVTVSSLTDDPSFSVSSQFLPSSESLSSTKPAVPSAQPAASFTMAAASSTQPASPSAQPAASYTQTAGPPAQPAASYTQTAGPSAQPAASYTQTAGPSAQPAASYTQTAGPSAQPAASYTQTAGPSAQSVASSTMAASSAASSTQPAAISTPSASASSEESVCLDSSGMPGMDRVDSLMEYLMELRKQPFLALTNQQVSNIVALWQNLLEYDRQRVVFAARYQIKQNTGRYKTSKKRQEFTPGVESVKRQALTTTAPLAQWPDCCRLVVTIFIRLCAIYKSPRKKGDSTKSRWDLILEDYRNIRQRILDRAAVMEHTTLVQWHNKRVAKHDTAVSKQGLLLPSRLSVATDPLLPAHMRPPSASPQSGPAHQYHMPSSTVGQAQVKRKRRIPSAPVVMTMPAEQQQTRRQLFPAPPPGPQLVMVTPMVSQGLTGPVLVAAPQALRVSLSSAHPAPPAAAPPVRKMTRHVPHNTCKKCGQFRTADTGHSQYKGVIYCPSVETVTKEQWLEEIKKNLLVCI
ncbi:uncharacterized protein [Misgurnus anguillicaudatus]|uniref:uncharacterized protein n=1 Tax=Misgurnus anguillicaudatus TaxID=75329 RepID=UPI003CCF780A